MHICTGTGLAPPSHIRAGTLAHPCHIRAGTGLTPAHICAGTALNAQRRCASCRSQPHRMQGRTPLDVARQYEKHEVATLLQHIMDAESKCEVRGRPSLALPCL